MIDKLIKEKIDALAYEKYLYRRDNNLPGSAIEDYIESEREIIDQRQKGCPKCGYNFIARYNDKVICLSNSCDWEKKSERESDKHLPDFAELKREWQ